MLDVQCLVLECLSRDLQAFINFSQINKTLYAHAKSLLHVWKRFECGIVQHHSYRCLVQIRRHYGTRRRVLAWAAMRRALCTGCRGVDGQAMPFLGVKLCTECVPRWMVSHGEVVRWMGLGAVQARYVWRRGERHYLRSDISSLVRRSRAHHWSMC